MRRRVGTVVVAEFTVVAFVDDPAMIGWRKLRNVAFILVDAIEQGGKRGAQIEAATAPVTNFVNTQGLFFELSWIDGMKQSKTFHVAPAESNQRSALSTREEVAPHPALLKADR